MPKIPLNNFEKKSVVQISNGLKTSFKKNKFKLSSNHNDRDSEIIAFK